MVFDNLADAVKCPSIEGEKLWAVWIDGSIKWVWAKNRLTAVASVTGGCMKLHIKTPVDNADSLQVLYHLLACRYEKVTVEGGTCGDKWATATIILHGKDWSEKHQKTVDEIARQVRWSVVRSGATVGDVPTDPDIPKSNPLVVPDLTDSVMRQHFGHLFGVEPYVRLINQSLLAKQHVLLYGEPGAAKTAIFKGFSQWLKCVWSVDAPTLTAAGLESEIIKRAKAGRLQPILLVEEIEKCKPSNLSCLLQIMDDRRTIQRTNYRDRVALPVNLILWATCNDVKRLAKAHAGALLSRFGLKLKCKRKLGSQAYVILYDRCESMGLPTWNADLVYNFAVKNKITDLRELISLLPLAHNLEDYEQCRGTV